MDEDDKRDCGSHVDQAGQGAAPEAGAAPDDRDRRPGTGKPTGQAGTGQTDAAPTDPAPSDPSR